MRISGARTFPVQTRLPHRGGPHWLFVRVDTKEGLSGYREVYLFRDVLVSEATHPFWEHWWPHGHMLGWEHAMVHELHHLLSCIANDEAVGPHGATFEDGYRAAEVCDAILRSAESGHWEALTYR